MKITKQYLIQVIKEELEAMLEEEKPLEEAAVGACKICGNTYEECEKEKVCPEGPSYNNNQADKRLKKRGEKEAEARANEKLPIPNLK